MKDLIKRFKNSVDAWVNSDHIDTKMIANITVALIEVMERLERLEQLEEVAEKAEHEDENGNLIDIGEHDQQIRRAALIEALEWASHKVMYGGQRAVFVDALERLHKGGDLQ